MSGPARVAWDAVALLFYLTLVYVWSLWIWPQGRDYAILADPGRMVAFEVARFGNAVWPYHLVNLALLYCCMLAIYRFTRLTLGGPHWLGTLAAALFMANPVHSEAVLNLTGAVDLLPALFALVAVTLYAEHRGAATYVPALVVFAMALTDATNAMLLAIPILYELLINHTDAARAKMRRLVPFLVISIAAWWMHRGIFEWANLQPGPMWAPLYFIFYPIGFLPENAGRFHESPWLGWVSAVVVVLLLALMYRKARRPGILFALLSMAAFRLFQGGRFIDPVHLIGGGALLAPNALFVVGLVALFWRMMDHPKWRRTVVLMTSALAVAFFGLEIRSITYWLESGRLVREFQKNMAGGANYGILPDYRHYGGAPMMLSESVAVNTPFSRALNAPSLLPLNYEPRALIGISSGAPIEIVVMAPDTRRLLVYPYAFRANGYPSKDADTRLTEISTTRLVFQTQPAGSVPDVYIPGDFEPAPGSH